MNRSLKVFALATALVAWPLTHTTLAKAQVSQSTVNVTNGPKIEYVDDNSAVIAWTTDQASSAIIHYGTEAAAMNQTAEEKWGGAAGAGAHKVHRIEIHGLKPDTTYYFQVESGQGAEGAGKGGKTMTAATSFHTLTTAAAKDQWQKKKGQK